MTSYPNGEVDRRWRHPWQVVRYFPNHAHIVRRSHRYEVGADWCQGFRNLLQASFCRTDKSYHDIRRTPGYDS